MTETNDPLEEEAVLISGNAGSEAYAAAELAEIFPDLPPAIPITDMTAEESAENQEQETGILLALPDMPFDQFAARVRIAAPFFFRHLAPVQRIVSLEGRAEDITTLAGAAELLAYRLDPEQTFSVQARLLEEERSPYQRTAVNRAISEKLTALTGARLDTRAPEQVVSVLCTPLTGYLGVSQTVLNGSAWPGGARRFRREPGQISRAEFKLLEAAEVFGLTIPEQGTALDIGAAPGGWTRVLRQWGLQVVALDPADLDPRLRSDRGILHVRERIQNYLRQLTRATRFDMIVNDMKMDATASLEIMLQMRPYLAPDGIAILTLKLPKDVPSPETMLGFVREDLRRLSLGYDVLHARQLFHNRSEITVVLVIPPEE